MTPSKWLTCFTLLAAVTLSACDGIDVPVMAQSLGTFERTLQISGPVDLDIRTGSGSIQIQTGPAGSVRVVGRIRANAGLMGGDPAARVSQIEANPPVEQTGAAIRIGHTNDNTLYQNVSISYELIVPADARIRSQTGSGSQSIGSVRGPVTARTGSGNISIAQTDGDVQAMTGSGSISVARANGNLNAQTGSGSIHANDVAGAITAQTGSGGIEVTQTGRGDIDLQTGSGSVDLGLTQNAAFTLSVRTGSGSIKTAHPVMVSGETSRRRLQGTVRGGGAKVDITTGSGSVVIR